MPFYFSEKEFCETRSLGWRDEFEWRSPLCERFASELWLDSFWNWLRLNPAFSCLNDWRKFILGVLFRPDALGNAGSWSELPEVWPQFWFGLVVGKMGAGQLLWVSWKWKTDCEREWFMGLLDCWTFFQKFRLISASSFVSFSRCFLAASSFSSFPISSIFKVTLPSPFPLPRLYVALPSGKDVACSPKSENVQNQFQFLSKTTQTYFFFFFKLFLCKHFFLSEKSDVFFI